MSQTATIQDVLEAVNTFATHVDGQFIELKQETVEIKGDISGIKGEIFGIKAEISGMKEAMSEMKADIAQLKIKVIEIDALVTEIDTRLQSVESNMVTKDYLDQKISGLRTDTLLMAQRANTKLSVFLEELVGQKILTIDIARRILALEPFPQG